MRTQSHAAELVQKFQYRTGCGVTFTFGGVKILPDTNVQNVGGRNIPGLYLAGEMVGGLFYFNYPSGSGLVSGAVFGRLAGTSPARGAVKAAGLIDGHISRRLDPIVDVIRMGFAEIYVRDQAGAAQ